MSVIIQETCGRKCHDESIDRFRIYVIYGTWKTRKIAIEEDSTLYIFDCTTVFNQPGLRKISQSVTSAKRYTILEPIWNSERPLKSVWLQLQTSNKSLPTMVSYIKIFRNTLAIGCRPGKKKFPKSRNQKSRSSFTLKIIRDMHQLLTTSWQIHFIHYKSVSHDAFLMLPGRQRHICSLCRTNTERCSNLCPPELTQNNLPGISIWIFKMYFTSLQALINYSQEELHLRYNYMYKRTKTRTRPSPCHFQIYTDVK